ncbi:rhodanese-like domain-containing protein [Thalassotalea castellviae]|uniref:Rhodanese-like domain-containing protein n=1 Tax=Thalassotalea castellviae TaxID=3075612 RepID=A0ABU2ZZ30_9GAMM|nr:rhodanese-like domain-containing protein [Thalassotalea sp. W431]MDT0603175.1 rhodanese-like domain-containing protein [Thalassotalea sp. W431]
MKLQLTFILLACFSLFSHANKISNISQQQLLSLQHAAKAPEFIVLDVRSKEEFNAGHIKGALNISHDSIEQHLDKLSGYQDKTVVVHCRSGRRAEIAEATLQANGFTQLKHLTGDYKAWESADLPLVKE